MISVMMTTLQSPFISTTFSSLKLNRCSQFLLPTPSCRSPKRPENEILLRNGFTVSCSVERWPFTNEGFNRNRILMGNGRRVRLVVVRGSGFNGGGGWDKNNNRNVVNLVLAIGLTYLTLTGQLGWVLDTIVSIGLLAVLLPIVGLAAFLWYAGRDVVQSSCPTCGNGFQIFKSASKDGLHICPYCSRPFTVQDDKFVRESDGFTSKSSSASGQVRNENFSRSTKGKPSSATTVDIEAEVRDVD